MKCPEYIKKALYARYRAAETFNKNDILISEWIDKNNIDVPFEDYHGGVESVVHPYESMLSVLKCIEETDNKKETERKK